MPRPLENKTEPAPRPLTAAPPSQPFYGDNRSAEESLKDCGGRLVSLFLSLGRHLAEKNDMNGALDLLLTFIKEEFGVYRGMVCLLHKASGKIFVYRSKGLTAAEEARGIYSFGEGITGRVVQTGQPIIIKRVGDEPGFLNRTKTVVKPDDLDMSFVCAPIVRGGQVLGCLSSEGWFPDEDALKRHADILGVIANLLSSAVELYLVENVDKVIWERRAQSLVTELSQMRERYCPSSLVGSSKAIQEVYYLIQKVANRKTTVLLLGESGVGKEMAANALHYYGLKAQGPLVKFNCAALAENLVESELFGHEKGSFTGASFHKGRFEMADGGTIFLDEIAELPLGAQAKLLRVLQERSFERVGGGAPIHVDIRVIAATNRDLLVMVNEGLFREDLYYRLNVFPILIPPLREREDDVVVLAKNFLERYNEEAGRAIKGFSPAALTLLRAYQWPGNVRELENAIHRAVILAADTVIHTHDLPLAVNDPEFLDREENGLEGRLAKIERQMLAEALRVNKGNISAAAKELGLTRRSMALRMRRLNLAYKDFRPRRPEEKDK
ncbi:MAG: sigma 54-interacting transcriptional regulator [Deltaproteobacteria bacterium]|jgi:Nif-specific regulatory protein|nr:sigma 54-interacting transcriptional regulator [Deltaproteobacteria bacterium]